MKENYVAGIFAELEAAGLIVKTGDFRPNRLGQLTPVFVSARVLGTISAEEAERRLKQLDDERIRKRQEQRLNKFVVEVRDGVVLFLNSPARRDLMRNCLRFIETYKSEQPVDFGWYWGFNDEPVIAGPFATRELALADAQRETPKFKVVLWDKDTFARDDSDVGPTGHIVVVDTDGQLWRGPGERSARR